MRLFIVRWAIKIAIQYLEIASLNPQLTDLSPLSTRRHPKCSCLNRTHSFSAKPTLSSAFRLRLTVSLHAWWPNQEPQNAQLSLPFLMVMLILSIPSSNLFSNLFSPLSIPTATTFIRLSCDCPETPWYPCSTSSLSNQSLMVPPM